MINDIQVILLDTLLSENGYKISAFDGENEQLIELLQTLPGKLVGWTEYNVRFQLAFYSGLARIVLFDGRRDSPSYGRLMEVWGGNRNAIKLDIPAGVAISWQCCGTADALIVRRLPKKAAAIIHPIDTHLIPFSWKEPPNNT